ncbi:pantoate--beta-alanine ligase [Nocardioides aurantiacus]|uniref:pantoate--beta-alanine ligase n=1 Tax=Nocardioides aurantiacus TaxID=86796 RepID=UPI00403F7D67
MTGPSSPRLVGSGDELRDALAAYAGRTALVPTMGALHAGHAALMTHARAVVGPDAPLVVSVFVNPMQFAPGEDLDRYPRTLDADLALCADHGVDLVLAPAVEEVYPGGEPEVTVAPGPLGAELEGASRPTHFRGVLTVVAKLFGLVRPDVAVFGEKDYQQLALVRRMAADLCLGVEVLGAPTVREPDGLALSSRNRFLDPAQRQHAVALSRALRAAAGAAADGPDAALTAAHAVLDGAPGVDLDYLALRGPDLGPAPVAGPARLLVAARLGATRLIDNAGLELGATRPVPATPGGR